MLQVQQHPEARTLHRMPAHEQASLVPAPVEACWQRAARHHAQAGVRACV
jgi:hypothetical protein